ncbi:aminotransferase class I/II-fold pyridoxal phosphate-dependent enzyme [Corynebacterium anserum]|uniref:Aminotransferase class I/II-fold pyridoxal phosphate-dependent enzyme n=1 Tax=Corynebacterium anserum TaxID=2684406 RepID=A0A7G7YMT5_9CORY|nr:aminotransferase class I/II-fold pyridoxal phosphate-dependent enzyme [Corynebacterium anserum]MBC2681183.1 aminotransferase class I/II-fold pyridoxal phosphate-dependent enzyme [Corynebacterium anserum]QNH95805.1 aminotransferase class I/II-fold pyridoxal phosphate-dependent enzyme [Corynebacterium anserum]
MSERRLPHSPLFSPARRVAGTDETIFSTITALSVQHDAANLGQGFPDEDGPEEMLRLAAEHITGSPTVVPNNQYAPGRGQMDLRKAIAADRASRYNQHIDPDSEILVTVGATEALAASVLGLVERGSEVVTLEPTYDAYPAIVKLAEAQLRPVRLLRNEELGWALDRAAFAEAVTNDTSAIILNSPHNPTGIVLGRDDLEFIASVVRGSRAIVITDEVYERLIFNGEHIPFGTLDGMAERTVTISSAAKTFNVTGWKTGWVCAQPDLLHPIIAAKQFLSYVGATPFQSPVAWALTNADDWSHSWRATLAQRKKDLSTALEELGFRVIPSQGTYFLITDIAPLNTGESADEFCMRLPETVGVSAIPVTAFVTSPHSPEVRTLVRWAFCKNPETMARAIERLRSHFG